MRARRWATAAAAAVACAVAAGTATAGPSPGRALLGRRRHDPGAAVPAELRAARLRQPPSTRRVPNTAPAQDYTCRLDPGLGRPPRLARVVPRRRRAVGDGTLLDRQARPPARRPSRRVVVHGFNTNAKESVVRWAAMLARNGFNVLAADQRDFKAEHAAGYGYPGPRQTFGWKEAEDVLAAGRFLAAQPGVSSIGVVGYSLGGQDTVLGARARRRPVEEQARLLGRDELQRPRRPVDAGLQHRRPGRAARRRAAPTRRQAR